MSGIALVLHERGCKVTGSDLKSSHYVRELEAAGIDVTVGHEASTVDRVSPQVVVTSTAIPETNPEVVRARELGIPIWPRAKMLSYLSGSQRTVAVAGTHGKTTTSSMVATMLDKMGLDPSFLIGGIVEGYGTNGRNGFGEHFVCEADESDGSFLYLNPNVVVVTNIEADHLDHYGTLENIERTFCQFMDLVGEDGCVVINGDVAHYAELARSCGRRFVTYGFEPSCDYVCVPREAGHRLESSFDVVLPGGERRRRDHQGQPRPSQHGQRHGRRRRRRRPRPRRRGRRARPQPVRRRPPSLHPRRRRRRRDRRRRLRPPPHRGARHARRGPRAALRARGLCLPAAPLQPHPGAGRRLRPRVRRRRRPARHGRLRRRRDAHPGRLGQDRRPGRPGRGPRVRRRLRPQPQAARERAVRPRAPRRPPRHPGRRRRHLPRPAFIEAMREREAGSAQ